MDCLRAAPSTELDGTRPKVRCCLDVVVPVDAAARLDALGRHIEAALGL